MFEKHCDRDRNIPHIYCPYCKRRLWHIEKHKLFLFYASDSTNRQNIIDSRSNIEELLCGEHGKFFVEIRDRT